MNKLDQIIQKFLLWAIGTLIFAMMVVTFSQVVARYAFANSLSWSEEVGRYIFVWITFLGMSAAFQSRAHVALDFLVNLLPAKPSKLLTILNALLVALVGAALIIGGASLIKFGMNQRSAALGIPMYVIYSVIPFSGVTLLYFALREAWRRTLSSGPIVRDASVITAEGSLE
ncbi:TRAP transporter small permease [Ochrobactrum sp. Marseille-Q0166]|uniref:TRAP transporter small permease n=1 Tax=Ochrobactrum sp. Marseille-Q0166 TaxID=2761105 RepID=UPI001654C3A7|nr:TRAP transporter small permease [Ochrobactrum sp. Marseille-Q0166]MBC8718975.1 TRAP transporter small permease [Ochrobactrum sp. Marseille-Q0166]